MKGLSPGEGAEFRLPWLPPTNPALLSHAEFSGIGGTSKGAVCTSRMCSAIHWPVPVRSTHKTISDGWLIWVSWKLNWSHHQRPKLRATSYTDIFSLWNMECLWTKKFKESLIRYRPLTSEHQVFGLLLFYLYLVFHFLICISLPKMAWWVFRFPPLHSTEQYPELSSFLG